MNREPDKDLEAHAARHYRAEADELDASTRAALRQARRAALAGARGASPGWLPAAAVAAGAGALAIAWFVADKPAPGVESARMAVDDLEILIDGEELDLLADLDFYMWLESQPDVG